MTPHDILTWSSLGIVLWMYAVGGVALAVTAYISLRAYWRSEREVEQTTPGTSHVPAVGAPLSLRLVRNGRDEPLMRSYERGTAMGEVR